MQCPVCDGELNVGCQIINGATVAEEEACPNCKYEFGRHKGMLYFSILGADFHHNEYKLPGEVPDFLHEVAGAISLARMRIQYGC